MSYLSEAHNDWHTANGRFATCPLDCGANEPVISECPACGELAYNFPSSPTTDRDCTDPAACDAIVAALMAEAEAAKALVPSLVLDDPWAVEPPF